MHCLKRSHLLVWLEEDALEVGYKRSLRKAFQLSALGHDGLRRNRQQFHHYTTTLSQKSPPLFGNSSTSFYRNQIWSQNGAIASRDQRTCKAGDTVCILAGFILMLFIVTLASASDRSIASCSLGSSSRREWPAAI